MAKLLFLTLILAVSAGLQASSPPAAAAPKAIQPSCLAFCAKVRCIPEDVCGPFVNSAGQTVCGCHPRP